ncbi:MAG: carbohydrate kinase [Verrucomicrobiia bacterium]
MPPPDIVCFGEMLWDCLPEGLFPGGAPMNVAIHLAALGQRPRMLSAVGDDFLGHELLRRLQARQVDTSAIHCHPTLPTGVVLASLDPSGNASYEIRSPVAWDHIPPPPPDLPPPSAIVFGSLAQRSPHNRSSLNSLLKLASPSTLLAFDINLRPPFDSLHLVRELAASATLLKLNEHEAAQLTGQAGPPETLARQLAHTFPHAAICLTAGERGAGLLRNHTWTWQDAPRIQVADTVGAGDSFLAALLHGWLLHEPSSTILNRAVHLAAHVASQRGATPKLPPLPTASLSSRS